MNYEPLKNVALVLLGSAGGFFINKGWLSAEQWASISGALITLGTLVWGMWKGRQEGVISAAANMQKVDKVVVNDVGMAMSSSTPNNVVASPTAR